MDPRREQLQTLLEVTSGTTEVHFQPPNGTKMDYPAVVFRRSTSRTEHADNRPYRRTKQYEVTVIDRDPDSDIPDKIALLPQCSHARTFTNDGLNHDVFNIYF